MSHEEFSNPQPRPNVIEELKKVAPKYTGKEVFLCFTCDPYQDINYQYLYTREAIKVLHQNNITVRILTKAGYRSMGDFDLFLQGYEDFYGATLTFIDDSLSRKYEPYAAFPAVRMNALYLAHEQGINTWASLEPVIDPEQSLELIRMTREYVDEYKVGKWNYDEKAKEIDWKDFTKKAVALLGKYGKRYYIKESLREYL
jgi:DNA repair photolyase